jgi:membrane protein implicated in regulation of membrane protease activity
MSRDEIFESVLIVIALLSLWPVVLGYRGLWYDIWLLAALGLMAWVAARRIRRVREAAKESQRKRDEAQRSGRPPWLTP